MAGSIDPITTCSTAETFQYIGRRAPPLIDRGGKAQQVIPPFSDRLEGHIMLDNTDDGGGDFEPPYNNDAVGGIAIQRRVAWEECHGLRIARGSRRPRGTDRPPTGKCIHRGVRQT